MSEINGLQVFGITDEAHFDRRFATFSITHPAISSTDIAQRLAELGIFVWHGNYYALQFTESLGLEPDGMVRVGLVHYNTEQEIDRLHQALRQILPIAATSSQP
jgi:selenocysteine lyase/cysteine desulfurase